jgi:hypothetical protein
MKSGSGPPSAPLRREQPPTAPSFHLLLGISHGRDECPSGSRELGTQTLPPKSRFRLAAKSDARLPQWVKLGHSAMSGSMSGLAESGPRETSANARKCNSSPPCAERDVMECPGWDYSGLMFANLITLAHFSVSSSTSFPKFAGGPGSVGCSIALVKTARL